MTIQAINKKHQTAINRAYKALRQYYALVDLDDTVELYSKAADRLLAKQEKAHEKYLNMLDNLPVREKNALSKQHYLIHGYT